MLGAIFIFTLRNMGMDSMIPLENYVQSTSSGYIEVAIVHAVFFTDEFRMIELGGKGYVSVPGYKHIMKKKDSDEMYTENNIYTYPVKKFKNTVRTFLQQVAQERCVANRDFNETYAIDYFNFYRLKMLEKFGVQIDYSEYEE